jgi:hypothetical protein
MSFGKDPLPLPTYFNIPFLIVLSSSYTSPHFPRTVLGGAYKTAKSAF